MRFWRKYRSSRSAQSRAQAADSKIEHMMTDIYDRTIKTPNIHICSNVIEIRSVQSALRVCDFSPCPQQLRGDRCCLVVADSGAAATTAPPCASLSPPQLIELGIGVCL